MLRHNANGGQSPRRRRRLRRGDRLEEVHIVGGSGDGSGVISPDERRTGSTSRGSGSGDGSRAGLGRPGIGDSRMPPGGGDGRAPGTGDGDGRDVARALRQRSNVPILMLTARGTETDRFVGLEIGADDTWGLMIAPGGDDALPLQMY